MTDIKISGRNFCGLVQATDIVCSPIALIAGLNFQAKSSLLGGVSAALTGFATEIFDVTKKAVGTLVRDGAQTASITVESETGRATLTWPDCAYAVSGDRPPTATPFAAGVTSILDMKAKDRAAALERYLKATPDRKDLEEALLREDYGETCLDDEGEIDRELFSQHVEELMKRIEISGWDGALAEVTRKRAAASGAWAQIAGTHFGSEKAKAWEPQGWRPALDETSDEELAQRVNTAEAVLQDLTRRSAVSAAERSRLTNLAAGLEDAITAAEEARVKMEQAEIRRGKALLKRQQLPANSATPNPGIPCPCCGERLIVKSQGLDGWTLEKKQPDDAKKRKEVGDAIADADGELSRYDGELAVARRTHAAAARTLEDAEGAKAALDALSDDNSDAPTERDIENAKLHLHNAKRDVEIVATMVKARDQLIYWSQLDIVARVLAPNGVRKDVLIRGLDAFNEKLAAAADATRIEDDDLGWPVVSIDDDLTVWYGKRSAMLSASEKVRARIMLQWVMAQIDDSSMIVIDGADILVDAKSRGQLVWLLSAKPLSPDDTPLPALVACAFPRPGLVPDLEAEGVGNSYWIEDGVVHPITKQQVAA